MGSIDEATTMRDAPTQGTITAEAIAAAKAVVGMGRGPGGPGFYAGNDWELFRNLRPGDRISAEERVVAVDEKQSEFSGRLVIQYVEENFVNKHDDLVSVVIGWR